MHRAAPYFLSWIILFSLLHKIDLTCLAETGDSRSLGHSALDCNTKNKNGSFFQSTVKKRTHSSDSDPSFYPGWDDHAGDFFKSLEYHKPIVGLFIPKGWIAGLSHPIAIQMVTIRPDSEGIYAFGWKPLLDLRGVHYQGSEEEFRAVVLRLAEASGMPVSIRGYVTNDGEFSRRSLIVRGGLLVCSE